MGLTFQFDQITQLTLSVFLWNIFHSTNLHGQRKYNSMCCFKHSLVLLFCCVAYGFKKKTKKHSDLYSSFSADYPVIY